MFTNTQSASPIAAFTTTNVLVTVPTPPGNPTNFTSLTAPSTVSGYQFTHWTVGGVRIEDITGRAANPVAIVMSNANVSAVANYTPVTNYTGDTLIPDWFKLEYYGSTATNASSDGDFDGFDLATEYFRGYHPRITNELVEGGVSRRRSETLVLLTSTNYARVTVQSEPAGITNGFAVVTNTGSITLPATISYSGYTFIGWFAGTNRMDSPQGLSLGNLAFTITNDVTFVAKFVLSTLDSDNDTLPDGYELYNFNSLANTLASDPDLDGFSIAVESFRSYSPQVFNELVEGGVSRRRSETLVLLTSTNYARVTVQSEPAGITNGFAVVTNTGSITLPATISYSGYTFIGWFAGTNRMDSPQGLSLGNLAFTITNDVTFVAKFVLSTLDSDGDTLADGYELYNFNSLTNTLGSDPDQDGFSIAVESFRAYSPQVFNELVEGGVSRRRSETLAFVPSPPDFSQQPASATNLAGANVVLSVVGHGIGALAYQWRLNGVSLTGATNATLTLTNAQFTSGGSFSVLITSPYGSSNSAPATVIINDGLPGFNLGMTDAFPGPTFTDLSRTGLASNLGATREAGEPAHVGKPGTNSVWLTWRAPASGIARVSTLGSGFDTLLGVYTGASVSALERVASDDDGGGFYTSALVFNATSGVEYHIAVDGMAGAVGHIILGWSLDVTDAEVPRIITEPVGRTVPQGSRAPLSVQVSSLGVPAYQWFKNGVPVPGADRDKLVLENIELDDAGVYQVAVWVGVRTNWSQPASLQIASRSDYYSKDKLTEVLADANSLAGQSLGRNQGSGATRPGSAPRVAAGFVPTTPLRETAGVQVPISLGNPVTHSFNNSGSSTDPAEFKFDFAGRTWFRIDTMERQPETNGVLLVESRAAGVDIALFVNRYGSSVFDVIAVGRATNTIPGYCRLALPVSGGTNYTVSWATSAKNGVLYTNTLVLLDGLLRIAQQPTDQALPPGGMARLQVIAAAQGSATNGGSAPVAAEDLAYQWFGNSAPISGATASTFDATTIGTYYVVVSNALGAVTSSNAVVSNATLVSITAQPVATAVFPGVQTSLSVTASGSGPIFYQWFRNGAVVAGAHGPVHTKDAAILLDDGDYTVVVSNSVNAVTSAVARLTVLVPPAISVEPQDLAVAATSNATFSVTATGTAPLGYQWFFNGTNLLAGATNASLTVTNAGTAQAGGYQVVVTNGVGSVTSRVAGLGVNRLVPALAWAMPSAITYGTPLGAAQLNASAGGVAGLLAYAPTNGTVLPAGTQALTVGFTPTDAARYTTATAMVSLVVSQAPLTITAVSQSREYGQPNPGLTAAYGGFVNGETNTVLTTQPVLGTEATPASVPGNYPITVGGAAATNYAISHIPGTLTVTATGPGITSQPTNVTVLATSNATFSVTATGTAPLNYQWFFNTTNLLAGATNASLTVSNAQPLHAGDYQVVVTNITNALTSAAARLTVLVPPSIISQPVSQTALVGSNVALTVVVSGTVPMVYQWSKSGTNLLNETNSSLAYVNLMLTNAGFYAVMVENAAGRITSQVASIVATRALITQPLQPNQTQLFTTGFPLTISGEQGKLLRVQASTDLENWFDVMSFTGSGAAQQFLDTNAASRSRSYYRIVGE